FVDGDKMTVTWGDDGKQAVIQVKPGTRKVQVKKDGFITYGEEVELQDGKRRVLTARLVREKEPEPARGQPPPGANQDAPAQYDLTGGFPFVHFGPEGPRVVLCDNSNAQKRYCARVYSLESGEPLTPPIYHDGWVSAATFSPDGKRVVTASKDK